MLIKSAQAAKHLRKDKLFIQTIQTTMWRLLKVLKYNEGDLP